MHDACCCYPGIQNIVIVALEGYAWATGGVRGKYIWPLPVISPVSL